MASTRILRYSWDYISGVVDFLRTCKDRCWHPTGSSEQMGRLLPEGGVLGLLGWCPLFFVGALAGLSSWGGCFPWGQDRGLSTPSAVGCPASYVSQ